MKTEMYDFDEGLWDFDWSTEAKVDRQAASYMPSAREKFDATDLKILKQLQMDGNRSLADMAQTLKINYKTLTWHYRKHIEERKLIKGYVINWMGTKYDYKADRALNKKHTYLAVSVLFSDLDQAKRIDVMSRLNQLPFIWSEAVGDRYEAELIFPIESITEGLQLLAEVISETKTSARYFIIDQRHALSFSIIPELYDETRHGSSTKSSCCAGSRTSCRRQRAYSKRALRRSKSPASRTAGGPSPRVERRAGMLTIGSGSPRG